MSIVIITKVALRAKGRCVNTLQRRKLLRPTNANLPLNSTIIYKRKEVLLFVYTKKAQKLGIRR